MIRGSFHRVERVLLALSAVLVTYILSGVLAGPDWSAAFRGLIVPSLPLTRDALVTVTATVGTTLAPWGLSFIQSSTADKRLTPHDLRDERIDVVVGATLTGIIGLFVVVACAATLHRKGIVIHDAADAALVLQPLAGRLASQLFGVGLVGAALLGPRSCRCRPHTRSASSTAGRQPSTTLHGRRRCSTARTARS
jgi:Mn2+/Fe2+ NRAMP family transporter